MISITIMADHRREASALWVAQQVDAERIVWDTNHDEWDTGARALQTATGDWHAVLQDDAAPVPALRSHLAAAIEHAPRTCISLYTGTGRPLANRVTNATVQADRKGSSWLTHHQLLWGVGLLLPTEHINPLLQWAQHQREPYDRRIGNWYKQQGLPILYCWPSLVDHLPSASLLAHDRHTHRRAHRTGAPQWGGTPVPI